tara:strand:- start:169 stop:498 length:330 start_codon:yes stop_codon:yes gene_type:complete
MSKPIPTALILKCKETERRTIYELGHMGVTASPTIEGCIELAKQVIEKNKNGPYPVHPNTKIRSREVIETEYGTFEEVESKVKENQAINEQVSDQEAYFGGGEYNGIAK